GGNHQAADGVVLVVGEVGAELPVEIGDRRQRIHHVLAIGQGGDQAGAVAVVVLVVYLADDLLEHVLDGDQAGDAAVFIDDDGHVVARQPELLEQDVQALGLGNQHRRPQQFADAGRAAVGYQAAQQVLGQQD